MELEWRVGVVYVLIMITVTDTGHVSDLMRIWRRPASLAYTKVWQLVAVWVLSTSSFSWSTVFLFGKELSSYISLFFFFSSESISL